MDKETGKKYFLEICDIEGDKKNQPNTTGMQLDEIITSVNGQAEICDIKLTITCGTSSVENLIETRCLNCKPKPQTECPFKFTYRCMQVCYYLFVLKWTPNQIADLLKCTIPNIDKFKRLCFDEVGLAEKDRRTVKLGVIWMKYYADWVDTEEHKP